MMDVETKTHTLPDGRTIAFCEFGDPQGDPVFHAHGTPSSRFEGVLFDDSARKHGFRVIATDRPGMGRSTYLPNRRLLDYPKDVAALADALGLERFGVMGGSGGGAHTAVCSYAIPERLTFNLTLCPFTNFAEHADAPAMLTGPEAGTWRWTQRWPATIFAFCGALGVFVRTFRGTYLRWAASVGEKMEGPDGEVARRHPDIMAKMGAVTAEAFAQGGRGVAVDTMIQYSDWGFRICETRGRVHVFHGTEDELVPFAFGRYIAEQIPSSEFHALEGQGHFISIEPDLVFETARNELSGSRGGSATG